MTKEYSEKVRQEAADRLNATDNAGWTADDMTDRNFALTLCQCVEELDELVEFVRDERETARLSGLAGEVRRFDAILAKYQKPDPLVEAVSALSDGRAAPTPESYAHHLRAELEKRGWEVREKQS